MSEEEPLAAFARGLHQDIMIGLNSENDLVRLLLAQMNAEETRAFRNWLQKSLGKFTPSELKGMLNRAARNTCIGFDSRGAYDILRAAADELASR